MAWSGRLHNYGGLSYGNVASQSNSQAAFNPREAARQGLAKMKALMEMGFKQGVLAPQERPHVAELRAWVLPAADAEVIQRAARRGHAAAGRPAARPRACGRPTPAPSARVPIRRTVRVHFTAANLNCKFHRSIEHPTTSRVLRRCSPIRRTSPTTRRCRRWSVR